MNRFSKRPANQRATPRRIGNRRVAATLVEAILVIMVLTIAVTTGMVYFDSDFTTRQSVVMETKNIGETIRNVRSTAIMNKATIRVRRVRSSDGDRIEIHELAGPQRDQRQSFTPIDPSLRISGTSGWVDFRPDGTLNRNLQFNLYRSSVRGEILVAPVNGDITINLPVRS